MCAECSAPAREQRNCSLLCQWALGRDSLDIILWALGTVPYVPGSPEDGSWPLWASCPILRPDFKKKGVDAGK